MKKNILKKSGQTLTALLVFMAIATTITAAAVVVIISGSTAASKYQQGIMTMQFAESAGENALLRLLRNPNYTGETLPVDGGSAVITVTGTTTKVIDVTATFGNFTRKMRLNAGYINGALTVTPPWTEVFP